MFTAELLSKDQHSCPLFKPEQQISEIVAVSRVRNALESCSGRALNDLVHRRRLTFTQSEWKMCISAKPWSLPCRGIRVCPPCLSVCFITSINLHKCLSLFAVYTTGCCQCCCPVDAAPSIAGHVTSREVKVDRWGHPGASLSCSVSMATVLPRQSLYNSAALLRQTRGLGQCGSGCEWKGEKEGRDERKGGWVMKLRLMMCFLNVCYYGDTTAVLQQSNLSSCSLLPQPYLFSFFSLSFPVESRLSIACLILMFSFFKDIFLSFVMSVFFLFVFIVLPFIYQCLPTSPFTFQNPIILSLCSHSLCFSSFSLSALI